MKRLWVAAGFLVVACAGAIGFRHFRAIQDQVPVSTGKYIQPDGPNTDVGSFPGHMILSPDGKWVVVSNFGFRQQLSVLDSSTGKLVSAVPFKDSQGASQMYFGLAFGPDGKLYVSEGGLDQVGIVDIADDGTATLEDKVIKIPSGKSSEPNYICGLAIAPDGKHLLALGNESYFHKKGEQLTDGQGKLFVVNIDSGDVEHSEVAGGFPFDVVASRFGDIYWTSERDNRVLVLKGLAPFGTGGYARTADIPAGANAANLLLNKDQSKLYVSNPSSDTVTVIDTATDKSVATILVRPPQERGLVGVTPLGLALSSDGASLYVACADLNAVAVVDTASNKVKGYIPAGWYPTSVVVSPDGQHLFVANAKGVNPRVPNDKPIGDEGTYIENILEGTVTTVDLGSAMANLGDLSNQVMALNRFVGEPETSFTKPPIKHVIYLIKENRTYDQVYGDMKEGNGDPSVCMFPEEVTPNQHALARRFALLDNFFVCAQVSADGWNWSTGGMASDYTERNTVVNYAGRGRDYDFEGETNDMDDDKNGVRDVARPEGGYIWDACARQHVSYENYGFFVEDHEGEFPLHNEPSSKNLFGKTNLDFREFDTAYADSDAWLKTGKYAPKQMRYFGSHHDPCRFDVWKRDFDRYVKDGNLPAFTMLRVMRDHTAGTSAGESSPRAMVADNDYAVGEIVQAVSHSPYWKDTVICILEDDAQAGQDHVDCHRSPALIVSPYVEKGVDHRFWNTDSMLKTMEVILGLKPMCQYDGFASPIDVFQDDLVNTARFEAILPSEKILDEVNTPKSYRAKDSAMLIDRLDERDEADLQLNDILMGDFKRWKRER